jgi:hypothetical protein
MSFFYKKESKGTYKVIQLISKKVYNKNVPSFMKVHVHWMNDEKRNQTKISKFA